MSPMMIEQDSPRPFKKQKLSNDNSLRHSTGNISRLFAPYRTIGLVSPTSVPFTANALGKTTFQITTSAGRCLQTYDLKKGLNLVFVTQPQTPAPITATRSWKDRVFAAWSHGVSKSKRGVWVYKRGRKADMLEMPDGLNEDIVDIIILGSWIVGCCATRVEVWDSMTFEHHLTLWPPYEEAEDDGIIITGGICELPTYLNKILVGREDGTVEIRDVSTGKMLYRIMPSSSDCGPVCALEPAPAVSLVAIAYLSGRVVVHDVVADVEILRLNAGGGEHLPVTSISFRTDGMGAGSDGQKAGIMATASFKGGDVTLWDLNEGGQRMCTLRNAHAPPISLDDTLEGGITKAEFLPNQAILVTSGADNCLRTWIFDETPFSPVPRPLHIRSGHAARVTTLNFLPPDADGADAGGKWLLSTSKDKSFWGWSLRRDGQSTELSQGQVQRKKNKLRSYENSTTDQNTSVDGLKAPPITCIACSLNRDGGIGALSGNRTIWASAKQLKGKSTATEQNITGWESVVSGHKGDKYARTWFWGRKRAGRWIFETEDGGDVTSVAISPCGTFAVVGSANGGISMFNLQSGLHRQRYPPRLTPAQARKLEVEKQKNRSSRASSSNQDLAKGQGKHSGPVSGLHIDDLNRTLISCSLDGRVKFWDFLGGVLLHQIDWSSHTAIKSMVCHRPNDLLAFACSDFTIRIIDAETRNLVRQLVGCKGEINDLCFSNDGRWIIAASSDAVIRVWDLPTGHLIDAMRLRSPCTALAFSNTGEYLATSQEDSVGINVWSNRTLFTRVPAQSIDETQIARMDDPSISGEGAMNVVASAAIDLEQSEDQRLEGPLPTLEQLSDNLETLSIVPRSRWQTLLHLDLIRARNKPKEKPKAPEKVPFFLSSLQNNGISRQESSPIQDTQDADIDNPERSRIVKMSQSRHQSQVILLLISGKRASNYDNLIEHLKTLSPAAADVEIRSLSDAAPYEELKSFIEALNGRLKSKRDYELVQTWMAVFLKCHMEAISDDADLIKLLQVWRVEQRKEAERLNRLVAYCSGVVGYFRNAT